jgi:DNA-binding transcriptional regulator YiaG
MDHLANTVEQPRTYYAKRKATGLCAQARCRSKAEPGRSKCQTHLRTMAAQAVKMRKKRIRNGLCTGCGKRPHFWVRECIICRQDSAANPLPQAALKALRLYRESEARRDLEESQHAARLAALELIDTGKLNGKRAEALRLYVGLDNGKWRTYQQVGALLNVSREAVRQFLRPSKYALTLMLGDKVPWPAREEKPAYLGVSEPPLTRSKESSCAHEGVSENRNEPVAYKISGLSNISLRGLTITRSQICNKEEIIIPARSELHKTIARAILNKPASLSGLEFKFLRKTAGLTIDIIARKLGVVSQTIVLWEASSALRLTNDFTARMVFGAALFGESYGVEMPKLFESISQSGARISEIKIRWDTSERR